MQFQVPQFIDTEDKIVGPLTLRQFVYIAIAGGLCAMLYFTVQLWLFALLSVFVLGGAGALSFVKVQGRPLIKVVVAAFHFYWRPQAYLWQPEHPAAKRRPDAPSIKKPSGIALEDIVAGRALHKTWEKLQTGTPPEEGKKSDKQFVERHMERRYQIIEHTAGDRQAARRVDYR